MPGPTPALRVIRVKVSSSQSFLHEVELPVTNWTSMSASAILRESRSSLLNFHAIHHQGASSVQDEASSRAHKPSNTAVNLSLNY